MGSVIPDNRFFCLDGEADYMDSVLRRLRATPLGGIFRLSRVEQKSCADLGYADTKRDIFDWPCFPGVCIGLDQEHENDFWGKLPKMVQDMISQVNEEEEEYYTNCDNMTHIHDFRKQ